MATRATPQDNNDAPRANIPEYSVSEISVAIKQTLENSFGHVRVRGEISGFRGPAASGHCYFAVKDEKARLDAVIWRGVFGRLRFKPEEGMEVIAHGRITSFPGSSRYQIIIDSLEPAGAGALMAMLEERKRKLAAEGLFNEDRKKPLPYLPQVVGIVTSPTGAVIRDMLAGFTERFPTRVIVWPVRVQGEGSAQEIASAIRGFNQESGHEIIPKVDVLIVARGGGSLEDLWSFNEEIVVRAAADSRIPLISAVGHETDWSLLDLVADARAPTPTKAAEWVVPKYSELIETIEKLSLRHRTAIRRVVEGWRHALRASARGLPRREALVALPRQRFDEADRRLSHALLSNTRAHGLRLTRVTARLTPQPLVTQLSRSAERLDVVCARGRQAIVNQLTMRRRILSGHSALMTSLGYKNVLARGYALVRGADGGMVRRAANVTAGEKLDIQFADGHLQVQAGAGFEPEPNKGAPRKKKPVEKNRPKKGGGQGSLF